MPESIPDFDLYAALGVTPGADAEAIRSAHREAVRHAHPDVMSGGTADDDEAKRLNVARDWLTDPGRRARYDESRGLGTWATSEGATPGAEMPTSSTDRGLATGLDRRDATSLLETGWWLLLILAAALIFATLLLIVADV
jgi:curved DNA-binding protein CbpA